MKLLVNLFVGRVARWRTFWLIGLPIFIFFLIVVGVFLFYDPVITAYEAIQRAIAETEQEQAMT